MKQNLKLDELSIIIPVYKEEKNIKKLYTKIKKNLKLKKVEIIYVDDNSKDKTVEILNQIKNEKEIIYSQCVEKKDAT